MYPLRMGSLVTDQDEGYLVIPYRIGSIVPPAGFGFRCGGLPIRMILPGRPGPTWKCPIMVTAADHALVRRRAGTQRFHLQCGDL